MNEIEVAGQFDQMNRVIEEMLKGNNPTQIAKDLGLQRADVIKHIDLWRSLIKGDHGVKERASEALSAADQHYNMIIKEAWDTVKRAEDQDALNIKAQTLKLIADVEQKRIDMLQKAGVIEKNDMAESILETERKQEVLVGILRDVSSSCSTCKQEVAKRLSLVTNKVEVISVD
jgi:hypothetical protein